jgi:hypothetical protein
MTTDIQQTARAAVSPERLYDDVAWFSRVRRDTGGPGEDKAAAYIASRLADAGVPVTLHEFDAFLSYPLSATLEVLQPEPVVIRCLTHSFAQSTGREGLVGDLIYLQGPIDERTLGQAAGRVALIDGLATPVTVLQASRAGCAAVVFTNDGSVIHNMICTTIWGTPDLNQLDRQPRMPVLSVDKHGGMDLKRLLVSSERVRVRITAQVDTGWRASKLPEVRIPGMGEPEQFVLVGGHYCAWDVGVTDNATGDASLLEMARVLWHNRAELKRDVRLCWWPGHSHGRYSGSTWYADTYFAEIADNCLAYHNIDSPGVKGATRYAARHTTAEAERFCRAVIERLTGQSGIAVHRPVRAADQSFLANGVPSFSTYPLLPEDHPDRRPWTGGSANAWWWHTEHDTLDKADVQILAQDTRISLTAVLELVNAEVLPFEHVSTAREIGSLIEGLQEKVGDHLDLSPAASRAAALASVTHKLEAARSQNAADPGRTGRLNRTIMRLSRVLNPVLYTRGGRFHHDPADWLPTVRQAGSPMLPALSAATVLPNLSGQPDYRFLRTQMVREINRLHTALHQAVRLAEETLASL